MPESTDQPRGGITSAAPQTEAESASAPPTKKRTRKGKDQIVRTEGGQFKKGAPSPNPGGKPKQIFFTTKPFKQALMREFRERTDTTNVDQLQAVAAKLIDEALNGRYPMTAITEIGNRMDGAAEREPAAPQQNTLQLVMNSIRVLNLTAEQRDEFAKQLANQQQHDLNRTAERSGGTGSTSGD